MKHFILAVILVLTNKCRCDEIQNDRKINKRELIGIMGGYGHSYSLGNVHGLENTLNAHGEGNLLSYGMGHTLGGVGVSSVNGPVPVSVPQQYPVTIFKSVPVSAPHRVEIPISSPVQVNVPVPQAIEVPRSVPYTVNGQVPYTMKVPVHVPMRVPVQVSVPQSHPVEAAQPVTVKVPYPIVVHVPQPIYIGGSSSAEIFPKPKNQGTQKEGSKGSSNGNEAETYKRDSANFHKTSVNHESENSFKNGDFKPKKGRPIHVFHKEKKPIPIRPNKHGRYHRHLRTSVKHYRPKLRGATRFVRISTEEK